LGAPFDGRPGCDVAPSVGPGRGADGAPFVVPGSGRGVGGPDGAIDAAAAAGAASPVGAGAGAGVAAGVPVADGGAGVAGVAWVAGVLAAPSAVPGARTSVDAPGRGASWRGRS